MASDTTQALSPLDGRYAERVRVLQPIFSEAGLITARIQVELIFLEQLVNLGIVRKLTKQERELLKTLAAVDTKLLDEVKQFEASTHHDVKAVEYALRARLAQSSLKDCISYLHYGLTSEDVNNVALRLMLRQGVNTVLAEQWLSLLEAVSGFANLHKDTPMLARTHGQAAVPTTLGKEWAVFGARLLAATRRLVDHQWQAKLSGAVGGYHAWQYVHPRIDWVQTNSTLISSLGFQPLPLTTQSNPNDDIAHFSALLEHYHTILVDFCQDIWRYISDGWLAQKGKEAHVGSSTMPQKINPIEFENAEGNLLLANSLLQLYQRKLPISRLQRDLSDSTVLRTLGTAFGHSLLAYTSLLKGLSQLTVNQPIMEDDLSANYVILSEAWQMVARSQGDLQAYESVASQAKQAQWSQADWQRLVGASDSELAQLTPATYISVSALLTQQQCDEIDSYVTSRRAELARKHA